MRDSEMLWHLLRDGDVLLSGRWWSGPLSVRSGWLVVLVKDVSSAVVVVVVLAGGRGSS